MANIPDFTALGPNPTPTPSYRRPFFDQSGSIIQRGAEDLGNALEQTGAQASDELKRQQIQATNYARSLASNAMLDHELTVKQTAKQIQDGIATGDIPFD